MTTLGAFFWSLLFLLLKTLSLDPDPPFVCSTFFVSLTTLYILVVNFLSDIELAKILSHSMDLLFIGLSFFFSFDTQKLFSFMRPYLLTVGLKPWANGALFREYSPTLKSCGVQFISSSSNLYFRIRIQIDIFDALEPNVCAG